MNALEMMIDAISKIAVSARLTIRIRDCNQTVRRPIVGIRKRAEDVDLRRHAPQRVKRPSDADPVDRAIRDAAEFVVAVRNRIVRQRSIDTRDIQRSE